MANMFQMAKQAMEMRSQVKKIQKQLEALRYDYENAGVKVTVSGDMQIVNIELTEEAYTDRVRLQRSLKENINKALRIAKDGAAKEMSAATEGLGLGSLLGGQR